MDDVFVQEMYFGIKSGKGCNSGLLINWYYLRNSLRISTVLVTGIQNDEWKTVQFSETVLESSSILCVSRLYHRCIQKHVYHVVHTWTYTWTRVDIHVVSCNTTVPTRTVSSTMSCEKLGPYPTSKLQAHRNSPEPPLSCLVHSAQGPPWGKAEGPGSEKY